jgi:hypothetical protein
MGTTTKFGWPYPDATDLVRQAPAQFEDLADAIETTLAGTILQVVQTVKTDTFTSTSTSFVDVTGVSVAITPTATTSKILVMAYAVIGQGTAFREAYIQLVRTSTAIFVGDTAGNRVSASGGGELASTNTQLGFAPVFLDSPATDVAVTYKLQAKVGNVATPGTFTIGRSGDDSDTEGLGRYPTSITVFEVAA